MSRTTTARQRTLTHFTAALATVAAAVALALAPAPADAAPGQCVVPQRLGVDLMLDDSGSMATNDPTNLRGTAAAVALDQLPDGSLAAAGKFSSGAAPIGNALAIDANSRPALAAAINGNLASTGGTDYDAAFSLAQGQLAQLAGADKRAVIFLSDGEPNTAYTADQPIAAAGVPIFAIGFGEAPPSELSAIATRSGGQAFAISSAQQAQEVFARIVSILRCDAQQSTEDISLKPGATRVLPFDVLQGDQGWRALVTWVGGGLDVSVIRPDGSRLRVGATGPNERVTSAPNSWAAEGGNPRPGRYRVELKAQRTNVERINVSIDSWQRKPPGRLVYEDFTGAPQPSGAAGCESSLTFKSIEIKASCLRREPGADVYRAEGRIRINGLDIVPEGSGYVEIAPKDLKLETVGSATVSLGSVKLTSGKLNWTLQAPELKVARDTKIKGFPVKGEATAKFAGGALSLDINVGFPSVLGGVTGAATLKATNDTGLQLDALSVKATEAKVRAIPIKDIALAYKKVPEGDRWEGGAKVELPLKGGFGVAGSAAFLNGQFAEAKGAVSGNFSVGFGVFLQEVRLGLVVLPDFALSGGMTLSAGPKVLDKTASSVKGDFTYQSGDPATFALTGEIKLVDFSLANGNVTYSTSGQLTVGGKLAFDIAGFGLDAQIDGFVQSSAFQVAGAGKVKTPVKDVDGDGLLSSRGIAGCGDFLFGEVGFGYTWGDRLPEVMAGSCDVGEWKVSPAASAAQQQSRTYRLRGGQRLAAFAAVGNGGPPTVTLTGPGGRTIVTPPSGPGFATENEVVFRYAADSTTYIAVARPAAGRWTITANPGSPALTETRQADGLPEPRVRARVRGRGSRRVLVFRAKRISGQRLRFSERGAGVGRTLATTRRARGRIRFRPADGPRGRRVIQVDVLQQGLPRERLNVASYRAPSPSAPGRVRALRLREASRGRVLASWSRAPRADRYRVSITVSDGRRLIRTAQRRRLTITGVGRRERVLARVRAVNALGRQGDARVARARR